MKGIRKNIVRVLALVLAIFLALTAIVAAFYALADEEKPQKTSYAINMTLDSDAQAVYAAERVLFRNDTGVSLAYLMFDLRANAYRRQSTAPVSEDAYPAGFAPGGVEIVRVTVDGKAADWGVRGAREQFLRVACALAPGESATVELTFTALLPYCDGPYGASEGDWRLAGFYPVLAAYDASLEDYALEDCTAIGASLSADEADYDVTLNLPTGCRFACAGERALASSENGREVWTIRAESVRELALAVSAQYREAVSGSAHALGEAKRDLAGVAEAADKALSRFSEWFGAYRYGELTLLVSDACEEASAYPGVCFVPASLSGDELYAEVVHLVAKQWFACACGANPAREPWLIEAVSAYAALAYYEETGGEAEYLRRLNAQVLAALQITLPGGLYVDAATARFDSREEYQLVIRDRGTAVMHELRCAMGKEALLSALGLYAREMAGKRASIKDFAAALNESSGGRWDEFLVGQMYSIGDYAKMTLDWYE